MEHCQHTAREDSNKPVQRGAPEVRRDQASGELVHSDLLVSAALCTKLDKCVWGLAESEVIGSLDLLVRMEELY